MEIYLVQEYAQCPSDEACKLINNLLDKNIIDLENDERTQVYGLHYKVLDLLYMKEDPWNALKKLI